MSRLGLGLGITKGGVIPFNPLSLDPYLLFDSETSMKGTLEAFTLDLDPSVPSTLDVITATRSGVATFTNANGLIASASPNTVRVDQTQGAELTPTVFQRVGYTDFSSGWTANDVSKQSGNGYLSEPSAIITVNSTSSAKYYYFLDAGTYNYDTVYTGSFFIRRVSGNPDVYIDNFRSTSSESTSISLTDDWQKIEFTFTSPSDYWTRFGISFGASNSSVGDQVEIAMPQVEEGTTATTFVANTTGSPKFITGATFGPRVPMILVEPSAINLLTQTDFSAGWSTASGLAIEQTTDSTPMASQTALRLTSTQISSRYQAPSAYPSGSSTASVYIKWDGVDTRFGIYRGLSNSEVLFNVTQGGVTHHSNNSDGYSIEEHGDGWWRVSNTMANPTWFQLYADIEDGDGSILVALPQHEAGSVATSYIPTAGSAVTRASDELVISGSDFTDFYNASEGTVYVETIINSSGASYPVMFHGGSSAHYLRINNDGQFRIKTAGSDQVNMVIGSIPANSLARAAVSYKENDFLGSVNGGSEVTDTSGLVPTVNQLQIGSYFNNTSHINGHIKRLIFWPYHSDSL